MKRKPYTQARPRIPAEIARAILTECGHRCAVCGESCPLERAHIIPWSFVKEHKPENLICLCANCHQRADIEKWGEKTLKAYKDKPWIVRRFSDGKTRKRLSRVQLTINCEYENFDSNKRRLLQFGVAKFLDIEPEQILIAEIERGSVRITLVLEEAHASRLAEAARKNDRELMRCLRPLRLIGGDKGSETGKGNLSWRRRSAGCRMGDKPGNGRYCCSRCEWSVYLDDDEDRLPPCAGCGTRPTIYYPC